MTDIWKLAIILLSWRVKHVHLVVVFDKGMHITDTVHTVNLEV